MGGHVKAIDLLMLHGANKKVTDSSGHNALWHAKDGLKNMKKFMSSFGMTLATGENTHYLVIQCLAVISFCSVVCLRLLHINFNLHFCAG